MTSPVQRARDFVAAIPTWILVTLLLALFSVLAGTAAFRDSATFDETAHIAAGFTALDRGDFRLDPVHPPLGRMWMALPLWICGSDADYESPAWHRADFWSFGSQFLYGRPQESPRRSPASRLIPARIAMIVLGVLLGLVIYRWALDLWDPAGALVALLLYALSPTVLAHAHLATTDFPAAAGYVLTLWTFWRFCRRPSPARAAVVGLALGASLLTKFSTILLPPILLLLAVAWILSAPDNVERTARAKQSLALALTFGIAIVCIWAGYRFRYSMTPEGAGIPAWGKLATESSGNAWRVVQRIDVLELLPEGYSWGLANTLAISRRFAYLNGATYWGGHWAYFPVATLLKTTPALLFLAGWALWTLVRRAGTRSLPLQFLIVPTFAYFGVAVIGDMNIGHRHLLPLYPLAILATGSLPGFLDGSRCRTLALSALLGLHAVSSFWSCPRYLAYFNAFAGGSAHGWRRLVDSNIDWGQDLKRLKEKLDEHKIESVHLFYFGSADPGAYGITFRKSMLARDVRPDLPMDRPRPGDVIAISVTIRQMIDDDFVKRVRTEMLPFDKAGDSIFLYRVPP